MARVVPADHDGRRGMAKNKSPLTGYLLFGFSTSRVLSLFCIECRASVGGRECELPWGRGQGHGKILQRERSEDGGRVTDRPVTILPWALHGPPSGLGWVLT